MAQESDSRGLDKVIVRLPDGMRDRIKAEAEKNNRSMNAEIVAALEALYPPEPSVEDIMTEIEWALQSADRPNSQYPASLIDGLRRLQRRLSSGIEFDRPRRFIAPTPNPAAGELFMKVQEWKRAQANGIDQSALERELADGLLHRVGGDRLRAAINLFKNGRPERALMSLGLGAAKFAEPQAAYAAIEKDIRQFYKNNFEPDPDYPTDLDDEM